ncbi:methionine--tRNA ligase [Candidatus Woesebacteria bacterium]|nr:methionine--tRNA ligase [Candidatus Woesebacteria bacterium]QQG47722.1 MAG: methionine--tRNA ligase [Candidatus Woesebacteria bacterium]
MRKKFYITSAIPYVNAKPHIGHALEFVQADTIARYHKLLGEEVLLLSGGDENALKNVQAAEKEKVPVQEFVDKNNKLFLELTEKLNCDYNVWQKGSDSSHHFSSSQKLWELCGKSGDIYKETYTGLYCVGCEQFYEKSELNENGECFEHPGRKLEEISEENYFFKLSKYQKQLIDLISTDKLKIFPEKRKNEVLSFLKEPLKDISISRTNERAKNWGVPVPGDSSQRIYVWFDALNIYQSGVGFGWDEKKYKKWWPADLHVIGKGIIRFHAVYFPAFLLSAKLDLPKALFVHDYFTVNGAKMSKTLGNVIDPVEIINKYGADALRYYVLAKFSPFNDGDFSEEKFKETYNADLANGLGNLVSRVARLAEIANLESYFYSIQIPTDLKKHIEEFRFDFALGDIWEKIKKLDGLVSENELWRDTNNKINILLDVVEGLQQIGVYLEPFLPETTAKIQKQFSGKIKSGEPLFPRIS